MVIRIGANVCSLSKPEVYKPFSIAKSLATISFGISINSFSALLELTFLISQEFFDFITQFKKSSKDMSMRDPPYLQNANIEFYVYHQNLSQRKVLSRDILF